MNERIAPRAPLRLLEEAIGLLAVLYLLSGRWSLARIDSSFRVDDPMSQPRLLLLPTIAIVTLIMWLKRQTEGQQRVVAQYRRIRGAMTWVLCFLGYMTLTAMWAPHGRLADDKVYELSLVLGATALFAVALLLSDATALRNAFFRYLLLTTGILALLGLASAAQGRLAVLGGGPNVYGRNMGLLAACCLFYWQRDRRTWLWMPALMVALLLILLSGSRGAMVATCAMLAAFVLASRRSRFLTVVTLAGLALASYFALSDTQMWETAERLFRVRVIDHIAERRGDTGRAVLFSGAIEVGLRKPIIGMGLGAARRFIGHYPHNLLIETFCEGGLLGCGFLLGGLSYVGWKLRQLSHKLSGACLASLVLLFTASMFSGDLYDSRGVFLLLLLVVVADRARDEKSPSSSSTTIPPQLAARPIA